jgi:hypothetical protein
VPDSPSLTGPLARIDRADELLVQLDTNLKAFVSSRPYTAVEQPDPNPQNRKYLITHIQGVPDEDRPARTPSSTLALLARAASAGTSIGTVCTQIHQQDGVPGIRRILGVLALAKKHGPAVRRRGRRQSRARDRRADLSLLAHVCRPPPAGCRSPESHNVRGI